eukprot:UN21367
MLLFSNLMTGGTAGGLAEREFYFKFLEILKIFVDHVYIQTKIHSLQVSSRSRRHQI